MTTQQGIYDGYHCPFCQGHKDYDFVWYELADAYLCLGCRDEIECGLDFSEQPTKNEYNCDIFDKLLARLGISYVELLHRHKNLSSLNDLFCRTSVFRYI